MGNEMDILKPLRLAVGSHVAGSGKGCAMNVISWENGDTEITDMPACADPMLARVVQNVNDTICSHRDGDLLCADCSVKVLALGHRTVGTALVGWSDDDLRRVYVRLALDEAESVARPDEDVWVTRCREVVRAWLDGNAPTDQVRQARAAAYAAATRAAYATVAATRAAYAAYATDAATYAAYAFAYAANAYAGKSARRLDRAHALIDRFEELTGIKAQPVPQHVTERAVEQMAVRR